MRTLFILVSVLWIAGAEPLWAEEALNPEDVEVNIGVLMGQVTMQLAELDACRREFPDSINEIDRAKKTYEVLMSSDLDVVNRAFHKLFGSNKYSIIVQEVYDFMWNAQIANTSEIANSMNELMNRTHPGTVRTKCQTMIDDVKPGEFRDGAILLRPLEEAEPSAWRRVNMFLRR